MTDSEANRRKELSTLWVASSLGLTLVIPPALGLAAGVLCQNRFGTGPRLTLGLIAFGFVAGVYRAVKDLRAALRRSREDQ